MLNLKNDPRIYVHRELAQVGARSGDLATPYATVEEAKAACMAWVTERIGKE